MPVVAQLAAPGPGGFTAQFQQFMYFAGPVVQLLYWVGLLLIAFLAWRDFKRYVDARVAICQAKLGDAGGASEKTMLATAGSSPKPDDKDDLKVEEFAD